MKMPDGLKLRGGIWWLIVSVNGTRIRKSLGIPKSQKKAAVQAVNEFWLEVARGNLGINKTDPLLSVLFDNFIGCKKNEGAVTSWRLECIEMYLARTLKHLGDVPVSQFSMQRFFDWLNCMGTKNTANKIRVVVSGAFEHAKRLEQIEGNPIENMPQIKHRCRKREPLTLDQFKKFGELAKRHSCGKLLIFLAKTGARFREGAELTWDRVDLDNGRFILRDQDTKTRQGHEKGLSSDLCLMLNQMRSEDVRPDDPVFLNSAENLFSKDNVRRVVKSIGRKIGRPDLTTHALRNTFVTLCRDAELGRLQEIQSQLGHASAHMTVEYDRDNPQRQQRIADKLPSLYIQTA